MLWTRWSIGCEFWKIFLRSHCRGGWPQDKVPASAGKGQNRTQFCTREWVTNWMWFWTVRRKYVDNVSTIPWNAGTDQDHCIWLCKRVAWTHQRCSAWPTNGVVCKLVRNSPAPDAKGADHLMNVLQHAWHARPWQHWQPELPPDFNARDNSNVAATHWNKSKWGEPRLLQFFQLRSCIFCNAIHAIASLDTCIWKRCTWISIPICVVKVVLHHGPTCSSKVYKSSHWHIIWICSSLHSLSSEW